MPTSSPIVAVLEALAPEYRDMGLRTWGGELPIKCLFHGDRHASASVNPDKGLFNCHVCDIAGDAIELVKRVERVDFATAKQRVAEITGRDVQSLRGEHDTGRSRLLGKSGSADSRRRALQARGRGRRIARSS